MDFRFLFGLVLLSGCPIDSRVCDKKNDCFSDEVCVDTACVQSEVSNNKKSNNNTLTPKDCEENADCSFGVCQKPEGLCQCPIGEHRCGDRCLSDIDTKFCGGCTACPTDSRGENSCSPTGECEVKCEPPFQPCSGQNCPRACVGCTDNANCSTAAPICLDNECTACKSNDDCQAFPQKICNAGSCVQCTPTSPSACSGNSCNPATFSCTQTKIRSRGDCQTCVSDSECPLDYGCVKMKFVGAELDGGYCLEKEPDQGCRRPFPVLTTKESLSTGLSTEYCGIRERLMTCKSYTDFGKKCENASDCGLENFNDAQCRPVLGIDRCTYDCTLDDDCTGSSFCVNQLYCLQNL